MSDLISRSKAISVLEQLYEHSLNGKMDISNAIYLLENHPTAYDVGKVVEELEKSSKWVNETNEYGDDDGSDYISLSKAIEIVKQGSVSDDVCEWKSVSDGEFIQNPHTKRLYSNEPSMKNVYCNTCGKKIKIEGDEVDE